MYNFNLNLLEKLKIRKVNKIFKFYIPVNNAQLKSIWAPFLTPYLNKDKINDFCKSFNKISINIYNKDILIPILFILYVNKQFDFILRTPTVFYLLKRLYNIDKIYTHLYNFNKKKYNYIDKKQIYYITLEEIYWLILIKNELKIDIYDLQFLFKIIVNRLKDFNIIIIK